MKPCRLRKDLSGKRVNDFFEYIKAELGERTVFTFRFALSKKEDEELRKKGIIERQMIISRKKTKNRIL